MALIERTADGAVFPVAARLLIGRSKSCGLVLASSHVSGEHATLVWTLGRWEIRDLGSKNGTFVGKRRLEPGIAEILTAGAELSFGGDEERWRLVDDHPPGALAIELDSGTMREAKAGLLVLPGGDAPELSIYRDSEGVWRVEQADGEIRPLADQAVLRAGGVSWRIHLPAEIEGTPLAEPGPSLSSVELRFAVSRDEEQVELHLLHGRREIPLDSREHAYVLLTLARLRKADADRGISPGERGWVERGQLQKMLGVDANALNVAVFRARQQLLAAGVDGAQNVVEVRRGQRRLGTDRFQIGPL